MLSLNSTAKDSLEDSVEFKWLRSVSMVTANAKNLVFEADAT